MNRRKFFGAAAISPLALAATPAPATAKKMPIHIEVEVNWDAIYPYGTRISCVKGDPGERFYGVLCGDGIRPEVWLDGVKQDHAETADALHGEVVRAVTTPNGNIAINPATNEVLRETVRGKVRIRYVGLDGRVVWIG